MIEKTIGTPFRRIMAAVLVVLLATFGLAGAAGAKAKSKPSKIQTKVVDRGSLRCGISGFQPGFSLLQEDGSYTGLDADMCRAVAAAVLGDANAVEYIELAAFERLEAVIDGKVDVLMRLTTNTLGRDAGLPLNFGPSIFYDGRSLMVNLPGVTEGSGFEALDGASVCVQVGDGSEEFVLDEAAEAGIIVSTVSADGILDAIEKLNLGECDAVTADRSVLAGIRAFVDLPGAEDWVILAETFSKEPLAPVVVEGDDGWLATVSWVVNATFFAEESGIDSGNIDVVLAGTPSLAVSLAFGD
ncbi:MAG: transporter substrate-binding domain-containing protein, partial [Acidimicrobiia bacterium]|nr:transporter substrate-binding domain-containing protein [Acidimicrobiia bacterium]